jgi:hypothetical protein
MLMLQTKNILKTTFLSNQLEKLKKGSNESKIERVTKFLLNLGGLQNQ